MTDVLTREQRRRCMSAIRAKDTKPEMLVRRIVHGLGFRYRLHDRTLPGCPDLVFRTRRKVVFVHGCFWHRHGCRAGRSMPATRKTFWEQKFRKNVARDAQDNGELRELGWEVLVIWECQTKNVEEVAGLLLGFLEKSR